MSLALEVREAPLRLVDRRGERSTATLFLHAVGERGSRPETIGERLNDPATRFVPVRRDGGVELVSLDWIAYVAAAGRLPEATASDAVGARHVAVELELAGGESLAGELVYSRPAGSARVSDLLNAAGERFLMLLTTDETLFVHRDAVVRARTL
ncbi:MAG: hypothetical protein NDJ75_01540 [Thermoanaerobaculia bacterium]|nr:hypothetical protein [Thermoanaerobaculia bacterium]